MLRFFNKTLIYYSTLEIYECILRRSVFNFHNYYYFGLLLSTTAMNIKTFKFTYYYTRYTARVKIQLEVINFMLKRRTVIAFLFNGLLKLFIQGLFAYFEVIHNPFEKRAAEIKLLRNRMCTQSVNRIRIRLNIAISDSIRPENLSIAGRPNRI